MDQNVIAGIGNIYSDEILFEAKVHPEKDVARISEKDFEKIYSATRDILKKAITMKGTSISDFRDIEGKKGLFEKKLKAYRRTGKQCFRCGEIIKRIKVGGRSAHFCPKCQKL